MIRTEFEIDLNVPIEEVIRFYANLPNYVPYCDHNIPGLIKKDRREYKSLEPIRVSVLDHGNRWEKWPRHEETYGTSIWPLVCFGMQQTDFVRGLSSGIIIAPERIYRMQDIHTDSFEESDRLDRAFGEDRAYIMAAHVERYDPLFIQIGEHARVGFFAEARYPRTLVVLK